MRSKNLLLPSLISQRARENPDRVFLQEVDGSTFTYREYDDSILRWAEAFRRIGIAQGDHVFTMLPTSAAASCAWLGLAWLRAIEAPCNTAYRGRSLGYLIDNSGAKADCDCRPVSRSIGRGGRCPRERADDCRCGVGSRPTSILPCRVVEEQDFLAGVEPAVELPGPEHSDVGRSSTRVGPPVPPKVWSLLGGSFIRRQSRTFSLDDYTDTDSGYLPFPCTT